MKVISTNTSGDYTITYYERSDGYTMATWSSVTTNSNSAGDQWVTMNSQFTPTPTPPPSQGTGGLGSLPWLQGIQPVVQTPPMMDLDLRVTELEKKLTNKTHVDVSKNQEERIVELERIITELMEERDERRRVEAEKAEKTKADAVKNASDMAGLLGSLATASSHGAYATTATTATQSIIRRLAMEYQQKAEHDKAKAYMKLQQQEMLQESLVERKTKKSFMDKFKGEWPV